MQISNDIILMSDLRGVPIVEVKLNRIGEQYVIDGRGAAKLHPITDQIQGFSYRDQGKQNLLSHSLFTIYEKFSTPLPDIFVLQIPDIILSGNRISFPPVTFEKKVGLFYSMPAI
ncbi:hypothetical protein [Herbaspirillum sp. NPDC101396]|uniref:hypothetical protein n=1 Tax=Herbaspirillum sp. NPDC101396 TaxID=3364005 RepID=UPI00383B5FB4